MSEQKDDCLFCQIAAGETDTELIHESSSMVAFRDINPQAPVHILIVPRKHIPTINDIEKVDIVLVGELVQKAQEIAEEKEIAEDGYRLIFNCGEHGGQEVDHLHLHLLGGEQLGSLT